ncbi:SRPBCC domain-containing protein [Christiangramia sediminis]|uniref:SRPBCC domain-containing protein n=1 Tax=Christiangramia sediminis TaxID=2881336 RepID=A0A9X1LLB0_9FLAO|nr:SRPBCC domain-containing protein [Christiangramia sediminis]MCB7482277.1 SRPBCC domain-containing protein [Christiangramia sediminis]
MKKISYSTTINCSVKKTYKTMIDKDHYNDWTSVFNPASRYEGSWDKGSKIIFVGEDKEGNTGGMVSRIKENIPYEFISIEHLGIIEDEKEITEGEKVKEFAGALENYRFIDENGATRVEVEMDTDENWENYFKETWPKALQKLKEVCENA